VSRRTLLYLAVAVGLVVAATLVSRSEEVPDRRTGSRGGDAPVPPNATVDLAAPFPVPEAAPPVPFGRPARSVAEYGVLTSRTEEELRPLLDRARLAIHLTPDLCGDSAACGAVRTLVADEEKTSVEVFASSVWNAERIDVDASARGLSPADRSTVSKLPRVVAVRVSAPTGPGALAIRTAIATTAAIARAANGLVWDQLLERIEKPADFAKHAVTTPLDAPCFRRDRIDLLYQPKDEVTLRILTAGLSRWGAPDVEARAVPTATSARVAEVVLAVARAIANGAEAGPITLTRDDLASARGLPYPTDAGLPAPTAVAIDVVGVHPENGDPNDFIARIVPPVGEGPIGYVDLAERFFGSMLAAAPGDEVLDARRAGAQAKLAATLAKWDASKGDGAKLLVLVPFPIPGDAGTESMWLQVTRYDARSITGVVIDDPLGATDVTRGSTVTRARNDVEDLDLRGGKP
jgi:hypothetical protein